jgi:hypothetical protein
MSKIKEKVPYLDHSITKIVHSNAKLGLVILISTLANLVTIRFLKTHLINQPLYLQHQLRNILIKQDRLRFLKLVIIGHISQKHVQSLQRFTQIINRIFQILLLFHCSRGLILHNFIHPLVFESKFLQILVKRDQLRH